MIKLQKLKLLHTPFCIVVLSPGGGRKAAPIVMR